VEPTAYAILGLRAAGHSDHPHFREGIAVLLDRALPNGGWNYGNTRVFENVLRPFPATTGVVLAALAGEPMDPKIATAINYLTEILPTVRAPMTLGWGLVGLTAWGARPSAAADWIMQSASGHQGRTPNELESALLLLASANRPPFPNGKRQ
jgi:hypothetical protein